MRFFASLVRILCAVLVQQATCSNIVGIFPTRLPSHYAVFRTLMRGLAERGHNVTVYSLFPTTYPPPNYTAVSLVSCFEEDFGLYFPRPESVLGCKPLLRLRNSTDAFDLLITQTFLCEFFARLGSALGVPVIRVSSASASPWTRNLSGAPSDLNRVPAPRETGAHIPSANLLGALDNAWTYVKMRLTYWRGCEVEYEHLATTLFGAGVPGVEVANTSYRAYGAPPSVPNAVEVGGIHVAPPKKLPKDIEKFVNESGVHGVVYVAVGTLTRLDEDKRNALIWALASLPQRVLLKWEADFPLPRKTKNMMTVEWAPQRDILAHPKIRLFVSHGDLLSVSEAAHEGVPVLGMPGTTEQRNNLLNMVDNGAAEIVESDEILENVFARALYRLINRPKYKRNALELSRVFKGRLESSLDAVVYWTEFVIQNRGAPAHSKTEKERMPRYQRMSLNQILVYLLHLNLLSGACVVLFAVIRYAHRLITTFSFAIANRNMTARPSDFDLVAADDQEAEIYDNFPSVRDATNDDLDEPTTDGSKSESELPVYEEEDNQLYIVRCVEDSDSAEASSSPNDETSNGEAKKERKKNNKKKNKKTNKKTTNKKTNNKKTNSKKMKRKMRSNIHVVHIHKNY